MAGAEYSGGLGGDGSQYLAGHQAGGRRALDPSPSWSPFPKEADNQAVRSEMDTARPGVHTGAPGCVRRRVLLAPLPGARHGTPVERGLLEAEA